MKFTPECLGFSNLPEPSTIQQITEGASPVVHDPKWKQRVPRDTGAGWDFEDVRDHYFKYLYGVDPVTLRSSQMPRYLELSGVVPGTMMAQTFAEWRSQHSDNQGALVWFYKDLWPAAGWGIIDSTGLPKAAYYFLKRTWQAQQLVITDENLNGLHIHLINETNTSLTGFVELRLLKEPNIVVARAEVPVKLPGRSRQLVNADEILNGFYDVSYAYRFGPPNHDVAIATLFDADHQVISEGFHFIQRREPTVATANLTSTARVMTDGRCQLTLNSDRFLHHVRLTASGYVPVDNYFHLIPGRTKVVMFTASSSSQIPFQVEVTAINLSNTLSVALPKGVE